MPSTVRQDLLSQQKLVGLFATAYLVSGIVAIRLLMRVSQRDPELLWTYLGGTLLLAASFGLMHSLLHRSWNALALLLLLQSFLILGLTLLHPAYFIALVLFVPVIPGILLAVPGRSGLGWVFLFSLVAFAVRYGFFGTQDLSTTLIIYAGFLLLSSYVNMLITTETALMNSQHLLLQLQESHQKLQEHSEQVEEFAIAQERNRLARELHDSVNQMLFSMTFLSQSALMRLKQDPSKATEPLVQIDHTAQMALKEMRALIFQLRPALRREEEPLELLKEYLAEMEQRDQLHYTLHAPPSIPSLPPEIAHHLFRILQEALHNVVKHTETREVQITLSLDESGLVLELMDRGPGFDWEAKREASQTFGLEIMHERAELIGASLSIESHPDKTTCVRLSLPLSFSEV
ncbi:MAG: sensor histidine kinase [Deltaproteobacteria bacterium]|nr:MAG: sensor histidine kinase [Deltaproteobacteria bacterium]